MKSKPTGNGKAKFGDMFTEIMNDYNREMIAKMVMRTASDKEIYAVLLELGRLHGYDLARGARALVNPCNLPIGYHPVPSDPVMVSKSAPEDKVVFFGTPYVPLR